MRHLYYVERLSHLKIITLERRRERYMIMYAWKMITGIVPNIGITTKHHQRHGRSCEIRNLARESTVKTKTICTASLKASGCSLFNILSKHIRNAENVTTNCFIKQSDKFLESVPDQQRLLHYYKSAVSNSIIDQMQVMRINPPSHTNKRLTGITSVRYKRIPLYCQMSIPRTNKRVT